MASDQRRPDESEDVFTLRVKREIAEEEAFRRNLDSIFDGRNEILGIWDRIIAEREQARQERWEARELLKAADRKLTDTERRLKASRNTAETFRRLAKKWYDLNSKLRKSLIEVAAECDLLRANNARLDSACESLVGDVLKLERQLKFERMVEDRWNALKSSACKVIKRLQILMNLYKPTSTGNPE